ncbi:MAG: hypothetical protein KatS3mg109_0139 [Pirellulaceae bacterium]|nr:MAG: hypothetical protein KatS3mg109_0139 [Pirellulaceae bacterium]
MRTQMQTIDDLFRECDDIMPQSRAYRASVNLAGVIAESFATAMADKVAEYAISLLPDGIAEAAVRSRQEELGGFAPVFSHLSDLMRPKIASHGEGLPVIKPSPSELGRLVLSGAIGGMRDVYGNQLPAHLGIQKTAGVRAIIITEERMLPIDEFLNADLERLPGLAFDDMLEPIAEELDDFADVIDAKFTPVEPDASVVESPPACSSINVQRTINRLWDDTRLKDETPLFIRALLAGVLTAAANLRPNPRNIPSVGVCEIKAVLHGMGVPCEVTCVIAKALVEAFGTSEKLTDKMIEVGAMSELLNHLADTALHCIGRKEK